ncbi:hypothetical protein HAX54_006588 [Datura stramonium]|uniref:Uncharacterized protein n=1 Tax=Datura stramonium TaxID=4076 RepID=A0ABS8TAH5_DATST|nr:hypothetical protein [Datura stramonium]
MPKSCLPCRVAPAITQAEGRFACVIALGGRRLALDSEPALPLFRTSRSANGLEPRAAVSHPRARMRVKGTLDNNEAMVLTDGVKNLDMDEDDDATMGAIQVDGDDNEDEDQDYNPKDDA